MKQVNRIKTISERLKEYRTSKGLTLADMEKLTGIPAQTINRYELGQRAPKIDVAVSIAESLSINPLWLQGYDVSIDNEKPITNSDELSENKKIVIEKIKTLDESQAEAVNKILDSILAMREKGKD